jgi:tRNA G18 (ribose-2'-O)-methylase SpoU
MSNVAVHVHSLRHIGLRGPPYPRETDPDARSMPTIPIQSISDPRVAEYVGVRESELRKDRFDAPGGLFIAEGELVVRRLFASSYATRSVLTTPMRLNSIRDVVDALPQDTPVFVVDQQTMNGIVGFNIHRGLLAIGVRGHEPPIDRVLAAASILVVLENLVNHDNLGAIFRNTAALAGPSAAILLSPRCADPLYRKSIRVSVGHALAVPFARLGPWPEAVDRLRQAGFLLLALTPDPGAEDIVAVSQELMVQPGQHRLALLLGGEGPGLTTEAQTYSDRRVRIDMPGRDRETNTGVDSLNVATAASIALHRLHPPSGGTLQAAVGPML